MSDRELIELAAKAAGIELGWKVNPCSGNEMAYTGAGSYTPCHWNPLTDDGDALRLAVKLGLVFDATRKQTWCGATQYDACEPHGDDPYAATRRAIVRAAAAMYHPTPHKAEHQEKE